MAKPRVIVSSDIGGSDTDDMQSMAHVLLYADQLDIKALISTPTAHGGRTSHIYKALDAYTKDYAKLDTWANYPSPDYLKSIVHQGNLKVAPSAGYSSSTTASKAIIKEAHAAKAAGEPLWVMTWGALTDVAQALHDDPSIASTIRVLASNGWNYTQDPNAYNYVLGHAKSGMWMIDSKSTHRGIYLDSGGGTNNGFNFGEVKGHGALGDYFYNARPYGVKMGDSWSIAYLVDQQNNSNPGADSWGGTFVKNGLGSQFWTDDPSSSAKIGSYKGAKHVNEHQKEIYNDMYKHFDRAKTAKSGGNPDDPVVANNDSGTTKKDVPLVLKVLMNDAAADGGLKIAGVDATSAKGGKVTINSDGTLKYTPKVGFVGDDTFKYTAKDVDGDTDGATVTVKVQAPSTGNPPPPPSPPSSGDNAVMAKDDTYKIDAGKTLWVNTGYLTKNDTGKDGGLKVVDVADKSEHGVSVSWSSNGTLVYKSKAGFQGTDRVEYKVADKDGDSDTAFLVVNVGKGTVTPPPPPPSNGDDPVIAKDDVYKLDTGKTLWVNTRYLTWNDTGKDGGLKVTDVADKSQQGVAVSWDANGTLVYKAKAGFQGTDRVEYKVVDKDGDSDTAFLVVNVGNGTVTPPPSGGNPPPPSGGKNNPVVAVDDVYKSAQGKDLYLNARYLTNNDKGADGGLKVLALDKASKYGAEVSFNKSTGTVVYDPSDWFRGTDKVNYTVVDKDGSLDIGTVIIHVA